MAKYKFVSVLSIETENDLPEERDIRLAQVTRALNQAFGPGRWNLTSKEWEVADMPEGWENLYDGKNPRLEV